MFMIEEIFNLNNWQLLPVTMQLEIARTNSEKIEGKGVEHWRNSSQELSPLSLYSYLKARFGPPNGFVMFLKNRSSDNLIHWQYSIIVSGAIINIWGKTSGIEISVKTNPKIAISDTNWNLLTQRLKADFKKFSKETKDVRASLEQWSLFINPFARVEHTLQEYIQQLYRLNLKEPEDYSAGSRASFNKYIKELKRWTKQIGKAASLGTTIRMLCPVMAEAFINLILLLFRKEEFANDERLYDSLIRQQIDVRIKTLHLNCTCFPEQIDSSSAAFKNFHSLMNRRNDFLHGNVDPKKLIVEDVWFDQRFTPLFEQDEGVIKKMMRHYCSNVEPEKAMGDFQTVSNLIELVLMAMDETSLRLFVQLLADRMPGINKKTGRLGVLFPSEYLVENYVGIHDDKVST